MAIEFEHSELTELTPKIAVIGVGGAGCNAVNNMIRANLQGVDFVIANTDAQSLVSVPADTRIQLGKEITQGLGAGAQPKVGEAAAEESLEQIDAALEGAHMAFITAGMGGGTGTGASPVVARRAREKGILTVGVVTKPFQFEGGKRMKLADAGIRELAAHVDTLIIIPNQNLFNVANERTTFAEAFKMADDVLHSGVRSITDLMVMPGLINLDFADVRTVMSEMGKAMMGTGEAEGENRALMAAEAAISNQLLEDASLKGAKGVIINVTGGMDMTLYEVDEAVNMVRELADEDALIVFGSAYNDAFDGKIRVSVVATGIEGGPAPVMRAPEPVADKSTAPSGGEVGHSGSFGATAATSDASAGGNTADTASDVDGMSSDTQPEPISTQDTLDEIGAHVSAPMDAPAPAAAAVVEPSLPFGASAHEVSQAPTAETAPAMLFNQPVEDTVDETPLGSADTAAADLYSRGVSGAEVSAATRTSQPVAEEPAQTSFFQKVTNRFSRETKPAPMGQVVASNDAGEKAPAPKPQPSAYTAPAHSAPQPSQATAQSMAPSAPAVQPAPSASLGGLSSEDRSAPAPKRESDEQMEIPAFLKMQKN